MILHSGRFVARLQPLKAQCLRTSICSAQLERVPAQYTLLSSLKAAHSSGIVSLHTSQQARLYATKPGRPKKHTGRTTTSRKPGAKKPTSEAAKPTAGKTRTAKAKAIPTTKAKAKPKKKTQAKPKVKKPTRRKVQTDKQKTAKAAKATRDRVKELKLTALTAPRPGAQNAWAVFLAEHARATKGKAGATVINAAKEASAKYKQLTPEEREHYNHIANQNKAAAERAHADFITSHTPLEIYNANNARKQLNRLLAGDTKQKHRQYFLLKDERQVKKPSSSFFVFNTERQRSNDYAGMGLGTRGNLLGREWKALSAAEKKPYEDKAAADMERYRQECKTVLGKDVKLSSRPKAEA